MSRLHRFYIANTPLEHDFWLHDAAVLSQWNKVLRFRSGAEVVLFDGIANERLYTIAELSKTEAHLRLVTEFKRQLPRREVYLFWAVLKRDKNDWVLQKATELGVSNFVPLLTERSEKENINLERAQKIVIEAAEQCGRSDIPAIREPVLLSTVLSEFKEKLPLYICEQAAEDTRASELPDALGVLIGPEGGWSDHEKQLFTKAKLRHLKLHDFTLRAETAAVTAISSLL